MQELKNEYWRLSFRANQKLSALRKSGKTTSAFERVQSQLEKTGNQKFPSSKNLTYNEMVRLSVIAEKYTDSKTFTLKGQSEYFDRVYGTISKKYGTGEKINQKTQVEFGKMFSSLAYSKTSEVLDSEQVVALVVETKTNPKKATEIFEKWVNESGDDLNNIDKLRDFFESELKNE